MRHTQIRQIVEDINSKEFELLTQKISLAVEQAFQKGMETGLAKSAFPPVLKKEHLCEILQVEMPTVSKLVARKDFPKLTTVQARYPRDQVFDWIDRNSTMFGTVNWHFGKTKQLV
ncbi:MAG: hypothetical protein ABS944_16170 [Solibacillus sp.]|uniref:hypothetical protein n=1 Tax=Solibacillus sp. TaxID=1909654 RepID=UPI0033161227